MTWAIQVENLSKQYKLGTAVTPAVDNLYQVLEQRISAIGRVLSRGALPEKSFDRHAEPLQSGHLVLSQEQMEDCPIGRFWALRDVSFEVNEGERVGIVGKNGSGKSTLLKILSRITPPTHGQLRFRGRLVSLLEVGTGFHPDLSGRENIMLNAQINGMSTRAIRQVLGDIVDFSELGRQIDTPIKRYSSGMYMRLAFSVAAHLESEILIVDEVLAVGDAGFQKKCLDKMLEISGRGRTLLFVSHDMNAISTLCTKALELSHGRVVNFPTKNKESIAESGQSLNENYSIGLRSVNSAISDYVLDGATQAECEWNDPDIAPRMINIDVVLRRIAVVDSNETVTSHFDVSDDVHIVIEFDINDENIKLNSHIYVKTLTGQRLFVAMDNLDLPGKDPCRKTGRYKETCQIDKDFLNQGTYRIEVVVCTNPTTENCIVLADAVSFSITDNLKSPAVRGDWTREWPDYPIRKRFNWKVEQKSEPSDVQQSTL